jgi:imidazoleglycerol-phosphate dehydratase
MSENAVSLSRTTKETSITHALRAEPGLPVKIDTGAPFFDHMLTAAAFHGGFGLEIQARGDTEVDYHHLVEDVGIVLGDAFHKLLEGRGAVARFGQSVIPMDDALSEAVVDVCERPFLVYHANFPQTITGSFPMYLLKEFFQAFTNGARINLHLVCRYGGNSHHMAEALFKAFGRALGAAYAPRAGGRAAMSTKGDL